MVGPKALEDRLRLRRVYGRSIVIRDARGAHGFFRIEIKPRQQGVVEGHVRTKLEE
ncbi:hypothetical protein [Polyangium sp. 6x1]|uniref:hypothetical protein n=1 Tax=Polyangium sp. 6x1 TaxID=3042689 RepID=UPI0024828CB3|nr:hypothetical protein [Polyangium sp. 6x1]MDI1444710.1 hypothetical protein [Polyangium sp. 6x1]